MARTHARGQPHRPSRNANRPLRKKLAPKIFAVRRQLYTWEHSVDRKPPCTVVFVPCQSDYWESLWVSGCDSPLASLILTNWSEEKKNVGRVCVLLAKMLLIFTYYDLANSHLQLELFKCEEKWRGILYHDIWWLLDHFRLIEHVLCSHRLCSLWFFVFLGKKDFLISSR